MDAFERLYAALAPPLLWLAALLPDRREALLLHHAWGFSFAEIGQLLGIRADAAKLRFSRGMADLRRSLVEAERG